MEKKNTMEVNDTVNYLVTDIFKKKYIQWRWKAKVKSWTALFYSVCFSW